MARPRYVNISNVYSMEWRAAQGCKAISTSGNDNLTLDFQSLKTLLSGVIHFAGYQPTEQYRLAPPAPIRYTPITTPHYEPRLPAVPYERKTQHPDVVPGVNCSKPSITVAEPAVRSAVPYEQKVQHASLERGVHCSKPSVTIEEPSFWWSHLLFCVIVIVCCYGDCGSVWLLGLLLGYACAGLFGCLCFVAGELAISAILSE